MNLQRASSKLELLIILKLDFTGVASGSNVIYFLVGGPDSTLDPVCQSFIVSVTVSGVQLNVLPDEELIKLEMHCKNYF